MYPFLTWVIKLGNIRYGITQWFLPDASDQEDIDHVLPNSQNFGCNLFSDYDLFNTGTHSVTGCGGPIEETDITVQVREIRPMTGEEQKKACRLAVKSSGLQLGFARSKARCYIARQFITPSGVVPGMFDVEAIAALNFDKTVPAEKVSKRQAKAIGKSTFSLWCAHDMFVNSS